MNIDNLDMETYIIAITLMIILMILWLVVQRQWGKTFSDGITDEDVLAGRSECGNCGCTTSCQEQESS